MEIKKLNFIDKKIFNRLRLSTFIKGSLYDRSSISFATNNQLVLTSCVKGTNEFDSCLAITMIVQLTVKLMEDVQINIVSKYLQKSDCTKTCKSRKYDFLINEKDYNYIFLYNIFVLRI